MLNVECLMLNVDLVGGVASGEGFIQARRRLPESRRLAAYRRR